MKFCHTAAFALVGWALIYPPMHVCDSPRNATPPSTTSHIPIEVDLMRNGVMCAEMDIAAPVTEWEVVKRGFATAHDCEEFRTQVEIIMGYSNPTEAG